MRTPEGLGAHMRSSVERLGRGLAPEDDWMPVAFLVNEDQKIDIVSTPGYANDAEKDAYVAAIGIAAIAHNATCIGMVATTWMVKFDKGDRPQSGVVVPRPSNHPDRVEAVIVVTTSTDVSTIATADISRHAGRPPSLGPWEIMDDRASGTRLEGDMLAPLRAALEVVKDRKGNGR